MIAVYPVWGPIVAAPIFALAGIVFVIPWIGPPMAAVLAAIAF
jgi:hypothetical protein